MFLPMDFFFDKIKLVSIYVTAILWYDFLFIIKLNHLIYIKKLLNGEIHTIIDFRFLYFFNSNHLSVILTY